MKWAGVLLGLGGLALTARADAFCGFYVSGGDSKLYNNATQVVMMRGGTKTVLSMANNYEGPAENFAMVVPVPVILQKENVKTLPRELFDKIDQLDAPRLVEYWEQDPCPQPVKYETGEAVPMPLATVSPVAAPPAAAARDLGVTVEAQFTVGEYEIVILSAKDASGLDTWLKQEHYKIPDGSEPYFRPYVQSGSKFFVAKVDSSKVTKGAQGNALLSPLRFHYDSDSFSLPVRLGLVNSKGTQDLIVHILAQGKRYEVANYPNVTIPTNIDVSEKAREQFGSFYAALYDSTLAKNPRAVVTEYSWDASTCDPCPGPALYPNDFATLGADVLTPPLPDEPIAPPGITPAPMPAPVPAPGSNPNDCSTPYWYDTQGVKHYKPACMNPPGGAPPTPAPTTKANRKGAPPAPPPPPVMPSPPRRRFNMMSNGGFTLTRLHARYTKEALGEDLVFKEAAPIVGGREQGTYDKHGAITSLEHGSQPSSINNFQGRYAIRHPWTGPIECKEPRRGIWGGPPMNVQAPVDPTTGRPPTSPKPAKDLAFVSRDVPLPSFVRSEIPELSVKPTGAAVSGVGPAGSSAPPKEDGPGTGKRSSCGCEVGPRSTNLGALAAAASLLFCVLGRRRRAKTGQTHGNRTIYPQG